MQDSIRTTPLENADEFRHDAEEHYLQPLDEIDFSSETREIKDLEVFASTLDVPTSIKIFGFHHGVTEVISGYYIVTTEGDYFRTFIKKVNGKLEFVDDVEAQKLDLIHIYEFKQELMMEVRMKRENLAEA